MNSYTVSSYHITSRDLEQNPSRESKRLTLPIQGAKHMLEDSQSFLYVLENSPFFMAHRKILDFHGRVIRAGIFRSSSRYVPTPLCEPVTSWRPVGTNRLQQKTVIIDPAARRKDTRAVTVGKGVTFRNNIETLHMK
jgi:hypothetical protein